MNATNREIQDGLRAELVEAVGRHRFRLWFRDIAVSDVDGEHVTLDVPSDVHEAWMRVTFAKELREACDRVLGAGVRVDLRVSADVARRGALRDRLPQRPSDWEVELDARRPSPSFESFVGGGAARYAADYLERVAGPSAPNVVGPIVIVGPSGSGKSHLLRAAAERRNRRAPGCATLIDAETLTRRYVDALRARDMDSVRAFEVSLDERELVLLDDFDVLAARAATQVELARLLDRASARGAPIWIVATRVAPAALDGLSDALRNRLVAGPEVRIPVPSDEDLDAMLVARANAYGASPSPAVLAAIRRRTASVAGAVTLTDRWAVASTLVGEPLDATWLEEVAPGISVTPSEEVVRRVKSVVARHFGIPAALLDRPTKRKQAALPRRLAIYLVFRACAMPLVEIGEAFGLRSHSSVSRAVMDVRDLRQRDAATEQLLDGLLAMV